MRTDAKLPELAVVLPVYKNADTVCALAGRLHQVLDRASISHELLFVDDHCPDDSGELLEKLAEEDERLRVLRSTSNAGQHAAVLAGLKEVSSPWVVVMDADLQDPPEEVPRLLQTAQEESAVVFAGRRGQYESAGRLFTSRLFKNLLRWLTGVPKDAGMFFVAPGHVVQSLCRMSVDRPFIVAMLGFCNSPLISVAVERQVRPSGETAYSGLDRLRVGIGALGCALQLRFNRIARAPSAESVLSEPKWSVEEAVSRRGFNAVVALSIFLFGIVYLGQRVQLHPLNLGDESYLHYIAWRLNAGEVLYRDIELFSYFPGLFYTLSTFWKWSEDPITAVSWASVVLFSVNAAIVWIIGCRWNVRLASFLCAVTLILVPGAWDRSYIATLNLLLLVFALSALAGKEKPGWQFFALGVIAGAGVWLRADFTFLSLATVLVCAALLGLRKGSAKVVFADAGIAALGGTLCILPLVIILQGDGILIQFVEQLYGFANFALERSSTWYRLSGPKLSSLVVFGQGGFFAWFYFASILLAAAFIGRVLVSLSCWRFRGPIPRSLEIHIIVSLWLAGNLPQFLFERPDLHHLAHRAFALFVGGLWLLSFLETRRHRQVATCLGSIFVACYSGVYSGRWSNGPSLFWPNNTEQITLDNGVTYTARSGSDLWREHMNIVLRNTQPGDRVASLQYSPGLNLLMRRPMPGRQVYFVPHSLTHPNAQQTFISDLKRGPVRYILKRDGYRVTGRNDSLFANYAPIIDAYISCQYDENLRLGRKVLLERNEANCE